MSEQKVRKNAVTGRFEKNPAAKLKEVREEVETREGFTLAKEPPLADSINEKANDLFETAASLERSFFRLGMIHNTPLDQYRHGEDDCDESDCPQPADPCPYYSAGANIVNRRRMLVGEAIRPMSVVRDQAMSAISALNYVLARAMYALDGDVASAATAEEYATKTTEGYAGFNETESLFNEASANVRSLISHVMQNLFGHDTDESEDGEVTGSLQGCVRDHLLNVSGTISTVAAHARNLEWYIEHHML